MKILSALFSSVILLSGFTVTGLPTEARSIQKTGWNNRPLVDSSASTSTTDTWSTYRFTIQIPATVPHPIQEVSIAQTAGLDTVQFSSNKVSAYSGDSKRNQPSLAIVSDSSTPGALTVRFNQPIPPGQTITIATPVRNPSTGGVYLFGVQSSSIEQSQKPQMLGLGRIHIYKE